MHSLKYKITTKAPVVIAAKHGDMNMLKTEQFIPGSSVLGMFARKFIKNNMNISTTNAHDDSDFQNLFLNGKIKFRNAYISHQDNGDNDIIHYPTPCSIHKEKNGEELIDLLFDSVDKQTKPLLKYCRLNDNEIYLKSVETSHNFHHSRDREKGISKEGYIFNYESIDSEQVFIGDIIGESTDLMMLIEICNISGTTYVGRSKNAQYGEVLFEFIDKESRLLEAKIEFENEITLTLISNTIIYNENGFPTVTKEGLEMYLNVRIEKAFIKNGDVENFVSVWRLKKPSEVCFLAGSTFLLKIKEDDLEKLLEFQKNGIGERTHEGFGQCCFGWQNDNDKLKLIEYEKNNDDEEFKEPEKPIPEQAKEISKTIIKNTYRTQAEKMALKDLHEFDDKTYPTNTQIGRLHSIMREQNNEDFINTIVNFRKTAMDKLNHCKSKRTNLFDFLTKKKVTYDLVHKDIPNKKSIEELCKKIEFNLEAEENFESELYQSYYNAFFSMMRKRAKTKEEG